MKKCKSGRMGGKGMKNFSFFVLRKSYIFHTKSTILYLFIFLYIYIYISFYFDLSTKYFTYPIL